MSSWGVCKLEQDFFMMMQRRPMLDMHLRKESDPTFEGTSMQDWPRPEVAQTLALWTAVWAVECP